MRNWPIFVHIVTTSPLISSLMLTSHVNNRKFIYQLEVASLAKLVARVYCMLPLNSDTSILINLAKLLVNYKVLALVQCFQC